MLPPSQPSWPRAATLVLALTGLAACSNAEGSSSLAGDATSSAGPESSATGESDETETGEDTGTEGETGEEDPPEPSIDPPELQLLCDADASQVLELDLGDANAEAAPVLVAEQVLNGDGKVPGIPLSPRPFLSHYEFDYEPAASELLEIAGELWTAPMADPEAPDRYGLQYAIRAPSWPEFQRPPIDLVVLVDLSMAMEGAPHELALQSLYAIESALVPGDHVTLIGAAEAPSILGTADYMGNEPGGLAEALYEPAFAPMADLDAALELAYETLTAPNEYEGQPRVLLVSNGHYQWSAELPELVAEQAEAGVYLSGLGVGDPSLHDELTVSALVEPGLGSTLFAATEDQVWDALELDLAGHLMSAALDLQVALELPAGLAPRARGLEPAEVIPEPRTAQLGPGEVLVFHQELEACAPLEPSAEIRVELSWLDPFSGEPYAIEWTRPLGELTPPSPLAQKGGATIAYTRALRSYRDAEDSDAAYGAVLDAITRITDALEASPEDPDLVEMSSVMAALGS